MENIRIYKDIDLKDPVVIAGWPGMGSVALGVVDYLHNKLRAVKFAEIKTDPLASLDSVVVEEGLASLPQPPKNIFYYSKNPDLIIFKGEAQVPGAEGVDLLNKVLDMALKFRSPKIFTGAAFPLPISHLESPHVYGAANKKSSLEMLSRFGVMPMDSGHIAGLNGLLLGFAEKKKLDAMCLLATMPQYAISLPNPKASSAIIDVLQRMLNLRIDMNEMKEYVKEMDEKMAIIEDKVKDVITIEEKAAPLHQAEHKKVPGYIMEKIEKLFLEAAKDKTKAMVLKKELDRWDLYLMYEDRFLDLFKNNQ